MPAPIIDVPTHDLLGYAVNILNSVTAPYTMEAIIAELQSREVPSDDEVVEMRGGIRPTKPNL